MEKDQRKNQKNKNLSINQSQSINSSLIQFGRNAITYILLFFILASFVNVDRPFPVMWNLQNSNEYFVGRTEFLQNMHELLFNKYNSIVISGGAGFGKAQVIKKYAELHKKDYDIVWSFDADKNLEEQYRNFAKKWNKVINKHYKENAEQALLQINLDLIDASNIEEQIRDGLRMTKLNWLIIFNHAKEGVSMLRNMPKKHDTNSYGHIIISTNNFTQHDHVLNLETFNREESIELLLKTTGENDHHSASLLADTLKNHPLAVARAGSFITSYASISMAEYNKLFLTQRQDLWEMENQFRMKNAEVDGHQNNVFTTISLIVGEVKKESSLAYDLIAISAFLDNKNIPESLLLQYVKINYDQNNHNQKSIDIEFKNALSVLLKYSLLTKNYPNKKSEKNIRKESLFTTHELIQLVMQDLLKPEEKTFYLSKAIAAANKCLSNNIYIQTNFLSKSFYFMPHIDALIKNAADLKLYNNEIILLELRALEYNLAGIRNDNEAERLIKKIEEDSEQVSDQDNFLKMRLSVMKSAFLAWVKADYSASLKEALLAHDLMKELPTVFPEDKLMIYIRLARMYNMMGDNISALKYADLGKKIVDDTPNLFGYKQDLFITLVKIYLDNGHYEQALKYYNLSLTNTESQMELLPSEISILLINTDILIRMNRYKEAMQKLSILKKIADKLPAEHFYKASVMTYYSYVGSLLGMDLNQAIQVSLNCQVMLKRFFGEIGYYKNRHAFMSHKFLGEIYEKQGDNIKAEQEYSTALKILTNIYSQFNRAATDNLSDIYNKLAIINLKLQRSTKALEYLTLHRKVFGYKHPRSVKLIGYFVGNNVAPWF